MIENSLFFSEKKSVQFFLSWNVALAILPNYVKFFHLILSKRMALAISPAEGTDAIP